MRDLIATRDGATYFAERVSGVGLRYDLGGDHDLVGRSAPDFALSDGSRLNEHLREGTGMLLDFGTMAARRTIACSWGERIRYGVSDAGERPGPSALLVRPDGIVAWATDGTDEDEAMAEAAERWFGKPERGAGVAG